MTGGSETAQSAAWSALYLYDIITEAARPVRWVSQARTKLRDLANWLYSHQHGGPSSGTYADSTIQWGAYNRSTNGGEDFYTEDSAAAGLALLRAYQVFSDDRYLAAARACAWFLRLPSVGDKLSSRPSSTDSAGSSAKHWGMWTHRVLLNSTYDFDHRYYPGDLVGLSCSTCSRQSSVTKPSARPALRLYFRARGPRWSRLPSPRRGRSGKRHSGAWRTEAAVKGFSTGAPREFFDSYPADKGSFTGRGSWQYQDAALSTGTLITAASWAMGVRAFYAVDGASSFVTGVGLAGGVFVERQLRVACDR